MIGCLLSCVLSTAVIGYLAEGDGLNPLCGVNIEDVDTVFTVDRQVGRVRAWRERKALINCVSILINTFKKR